MSRFPIGGGGWAYFHVPGSNSLSAYAKTFDFVEVNSTFYEYPSTQAVRSRRRVPKDFEFTVRCHQDIAHRNRLEPSDTNMVCLEKMIDVCEALKASVLHILVPREIRLEGRRMMRARDLFESVSSNRVRIALEIGRGQTHALDLDKVQIRQDLNIVHCVDLSHEEPTYRSDILYARLFGPTGDNRYQFTDEEPKNINTRASKPEFEKSVLAFHGVKMYKDATRLKVFRSTGRFPMATSTVGFESLREVLSEDASFPASRESLIEKQGWKIVDLTLEKRVQAAKLLVNLPKRQYHSVEDVLTTFTTWNQSLIP